MTGERQLYRDFRSGHLNESLGVQLLRNLAAVASIPQSEDVGVDALATLLRPEEKLFYPETSFYVQFKSESRKPLSYKGHEVEWLRNLQLPFVVGVVRKRDSRLSLIPGTELNAVL